MLWREFKTMGPLQAKGLVNLRAIYAYSHILQQT